MQMMVCAAGSRPQSRTVTSAAAAMRAGVNNSNNFPRPGGGVATPAPIYATSGGSGSGGRGTAAHRGAKHDQHTTPHITQHNTHRLTPHNAHQS